MSVHPHHFVKIFLFLNFILIHHNQLNPNTIKISKIMIKHPTSNIFPIFLKINFKNLHAKEMQQIHYPQVILRKNCSGTKCNNPYFPYNRNFTA